MNINYYNPYVRAELELYHHGVTGQRWGKRNGPPYPLGKSQVSAAEKKAGWTESDWADGKPGNRNASSKVLNTNGSNENNKVQISDETKKKIIIGAAVTAGVIAAGVGGYALYKSGALNTVMSGVVNAGKAAFSKIGDLKAAIPRTKNQKISDAVKKLSDSELTATINRLKQENELGSLLGSTRSINGSSTMGNITRKMVDGLADKIIVPIGVGVMAYEIKTHSDLNDDARSEIFRNVNAKKK